VDHELVKSSHYAWPLKTKGEIPMPERRRRKLVNKFQHKLIARMIFYGAVYQLTLWNFLFCWRLLASGGGNFFQEYAQFSREFAPMLLCFLLVMPPLIWDAVRFSHRIAGPIVQINSAIRNVTEGSPLDYVRLRENDELTELQDDFNSMLDTLSRAGTVNLVTPVKSEGTSKTDFAGNANLAGTADEEVSYVSH
jgi:methyl-accepting chemotaxis protein